MTAAKIVKFRHYCTQPNPCGVVADAATGTGPPAFAMLVERSAVVVEGRVVHLSDSPEDAREYCRRKGLDVADA